MDTHRLNINASQTMSSGLRSPRMNLSMPAKIASLTEGLIDNTRIDHAFSSCRGLP